MTSTQSLQFKISYLQQQMLEREEAFQAEKEAKEAEIGSLMVQLERAEYLCGIAKCKQCEVYQRQIEKQDRLIESFKLQFPAIISFMKTMQLPLESGVCDVEQNQVYQSLLQQISDTRTRNGELQEENDLMTTYIAYITAENARLQLSLESLQLELDKQEDERQYCRSLVCSIEKLFGRVQDLEYQVFVENAKIYAIVR